MRHQHAEQIDRHAAGEHREPGQQLPLVLRQPLRVVGEHSCELGRPRVVALDRVEVELLDRLDASLGKGAKIGSEHRHRERVVADLRCRGAQCPVVPVYAPTAQDGHRRVRREVIERGVAISPVRPGLEIDERVP